MAGRRSKPKERDPEKVLEEFGIPEDRPIPEDYLNREDAWYRAYAHAANYSKHNGIKACVIFAEARWLDEEFQDDGSES